MSGFNLDDYVTVAERVEQFYAKFPEGSLQAEVVEMSEKLVVVRAYAYRTAEDVRPGIAHSSLIIPGSTPYTKGSELENAETSAVGRAIALLGFGVKKSIASRNELEAKGADQVLPPAQREGSLVGIARVGTATTSDGQLRQTSDGGARLGFRLEPRSGDKGAILVEVNDPLASALAVIREQWFNQPVTCWGLIEPREFVPKGKTKPVTYQALVLSRIQTPTGTIPAEGEPGIAPQAQAAKADEPTGADSSKDAPTDVPAHGPDAAGGNVTEPDRGSPPAPVPVVAEPTNGLCGNPSPYGDEAGCELLTGHKGPHKILSNAFPTSWAVPT